MLLKDQLKRLFPHINYLFLTGVVIIVIGIILFIISAHQMQRVEEANSTEQSMTNFFEHNPTMWNPLITFFGARAQEKIQYYSWVTRMMQIGGIVLIALGAIIATLSLKKTRK